LKLEVGSWKIAPRYPATLLKALSNFLYCGFSTSTHTCNHQKNVKMSGHCHDDHDHSGHDHAGHDHSDDITPALQYSLYQHINFDDITTRNESEPHSGKAIVKKTWAERLEDQPELESDADEQLLMHIPCVCIL
jgi:PITH domain